MSLDGLQLGAYQRFTEDLLEIIWLHFIVVIAY